MKIFDLLIPEFSENASGIEPSPNALYQDDVLVEVTLLDLLHYTLYSTAALLMDLRTSLYPYQGNTGIMVFRKVSEIVVNDNFNQSLHPSHVWTLGDARLTKTERGLEFLLPFAKGKVQLVAPKVEFYVGNVKNIGNAAASIPDGITGYIQTTPHWESDFEIIALSSRT